MGNIFIALIIGIGGIIILSIINCIIQKRRANNFYQEGFVSSIDSGINIEKDKDKN